ncbi:MAG: hypothetical protein Q7J66_04295 [Hydrogenophaga sp.]|nr:hypothetical protein [Hydrogenophaga sp.]
MALEPKVNSHVTRLNRHLPFSPSHAQIYEEYQTDNDSLDFKTQALVYLLNAINSGAKVVVLTGDAGHGKTHLCRRIITDYLGYPSQLARDLLLSECNGLSAIPPLDSESGKKPLRIHKDFSELDVNDAAEFIENTSCYPESVTIVCANEGRLRAVISQSSSGNICNQIFKTFQESFRTGSCSIDSEVHIVNLNYQSVSDSSVSKESLVKLAFKKWVADDKRWNQSCGSCKYANKCPIFWNRTLLASHGKDTASQRVLRIEELLSTIERLGFVVTIREMLMLLAYIITGGLSCVDVHRQAASSKIWQNRYAFYNLLFEKPEALPEDRLLKGIPILSAFFRMDPGKRAFRPLDEKLLNIGDVFEPDQLDLKFEITLSGNKKTIDASGGIDEIVGNPKSKGERDRESQAVLNVVTALRRRAFFDDNYPSGGLLNRLGFSYGSQFLEIISQDIPAEKMIKLKNMLMAGLHTVQGLRMSGTETNLNLVDPAFGRATSDAAIISRRIPSKSIKLMSRRSAWEVEGVEIQWSLASSVDWINRQVVLRVDDPEKGISDLQLDLLSFECLARAAKGYLADDFYSHELRRIRTFLGRLAEGGLSEYGQIILFMKGRSYTVSIDSGVIQVGGGA